MPGERRVVEELLDGRAPRPTRARGGGARECVLSRRRTRLRTASMLGPAGHVDRLDLRCGTTCALALPACTVLTRPSASATMRPRSPRPRGAGPRRAALGSGPDRSPRRRGWSVASARALIAVGLLRFAPARPAPRSTPRSEARCELLADAVAAPPRGDAWASSVSAAPPAARPAVQSRARSVTLRVAPGPAPHGGRRLAAGGRGGADGSASSGAPRARRPGYPIRSPCSPRRRCPRARAMTVGRAKPEARGDR